MQVWSPCPRDRNAADLAAAARPGGRASIAPTAGWSAAVIGRAPHMPPCRQRGGGGSPGAFTAVALALPFQSARAHRLWGQCSHNPDAKLQNDKSAINVRLIHHVLRCGMWIIPVFNERTGGLSRALPGKSPIPVAARERNPQHFHRVRTASTPLHTSHPHVCAQIAGSSRPRNPPPTRLDARPAPLDHEGGVPLVVAGRPGWCGCAVRVRGAGARCGCAVRGWRGRAGSGWDRGPFQPNGAGCPPPRHSSRGHRGSSKKCGEGASPGRSARPGGNRHDVTSWRSPYSVPLPSDRINVTSWRFGSAGCWCRCDGSGSWEYETA